MLDEWALDIIYSQIILADNMPNYVVSAVPADGQVPSSTKPFGGTAVAKVGSRQCVMAIGPV